MSARNRVIEKEDIVGALDAAKAVSIPPDRQILHVLAQEYVVDDQEAIGDPSGMSGARLEANVHVVTASSTSTQNTISCLHRAGLKWASTVLAQLAAAGALCHPGREGSRGRGRTLGSGTVDIAIFEKGSLRPPAVNPFGGEHFTNDVAVAPRTGVTEAERVKKSMAAPSSPWYPRRT